MIADEGYGAEADILQIYAMNSPHYLIFSEPIIDSNATAGKEFDDPSTPKSNGIELN